MCGINGFYDLKRKYHTDQTRSIVHEMNERIVYRGPDHEGMFQNGCLTMGMRRLSIHDLKDGNQPIYNEDQSVAVVFNGEIYNFVLLRESLMKKGHRFYTTADTEVIVHAYEEYGSGMFEKLDGMFAIAIYDIRKKKLLLARDRMGEKPLYYYNGDGIFLWASELKSLIGTGEVKKQIDKTALNQYFQMTYIPAPLTIYQDIYKLMPGHYLSVGADGSMTDEAYWSLRNIKRNTDITYEEAKEQLERLLKQSIQERMASDVPVGAFLSGGIDSGTVVSIMAELSDIPVETFTMGFKEREYDERDRAALVADMYQTNHHEYELDYGEVLREINRILEGLDEPFADSSILPTYFVSRFAGHYVKVALTGDAGDELFLGYSKYLVGYYSRLFHKFPGWMQNCFRKIVYALPDKSVASRKVRKVLNACGLDDYGRYLEMVSLGYKESERRKLLREEYYSKNSMDFLKERYYGIDGNEWRKTQYADLTTVLEGDMLAKVDRMSMRSSLETRTPLLAKDIIEFAFALPDKYKIKGKRLKCILKDAFEKRLPDDFAKLPKSGFGIPLDHWFRNELREWVEELLAPERLEREGILDSAYVQEILKEHMSGRVNRKSEIWALLVFETWYGREMAG